MTEPYLGEIRLFGFNFAPRGWAKCDGELLAITQYESLYSILGTTFGGDGRTTFALPDLRGRLPIHASSSYSAGSKGGIEEITLTEAQIPAHTHTMRGTSDNALADPVQGATPTNHVLAKSSISIYTDAGNTAAMNTVSIGKNSGGQPFSNMQPFLAVEFCIALTGTFPPRN
ncbi:MAG: tail fiber protein [Cyanobacteria bacterium P01_G01_bin.38]